MEEDLKGKEEPCSFKQLLFLSKLSNRESLAFEGQILSILFNQS